MKKHIYIYSPSSAVREKAVIRRGVARLRALGYEVELDEAVFATCVLPATTRPGWRQSIEQPRAARTWP